MMRRLLWMCVLLAGPLTITWAQTPVAPGGLVMQAQVGHSNTLGGIAWASNNRLVTVGYDNRLVLWDTDARRVLRSRFCDSGDVPRVLATPNHRYLCWNEADAQGLKLRMSDARTLQPLPTQFPPPHTATRKQIQGYGKHETLAISPDSSLIATTWGDNVYGVYDIKSGGLINAQAFSNTCHIGAIVFSPDSGHLAIVYNEDLAGDAAHNSVGSHEFGCIRLLDAKTGAVEHEERIPSVYPTTAAFIDDRHLVIATFAAESLQSNLPSEKVPGTLLLWDDVIGEIVDKRPTESYPEKVLTFGDHLFAVLVNGEIRRYSANLRGNPLIASGSHLRGDGEAPFRDLAVSPDGALLASANEARIGLWTMPDLQPAGLIRAPSQRILSAAVAPDGSHLILDNGTSLIVWSRRRLATEQTRLLPAHTALAIAPGADRYALGPQEGHKETQHIDIYGLSSETPLRHLTFAPVTNQNAPPSQADLAGVLVVTELVWSPEGKFVAALRTDERQTRTVFTLWNSETGERLAQYPTSLHGITLRLNGDEIAGLDDSYSVVRMDPRTSDVRQRVKTDTPSLNQYRLGYSADGKYLGYAVIGRVCVWETDTGRLLAKSTRGHTWDVTSLTFSPDDRYLATGSGDLSIKLWQVPQVMPLDPNPQMGILTLVATLALHTEAVNALCWSENHAADAVQLFSASGDGTVRLWTALKKDNSSWFSPATLLFGRGANNTTASLEVLSDGTYASEKDGATLAAFRIKDASGQELALPMEQFDLILNRPDRVLAILGDDAPETAQRIADYTRAWARRLRAAGKSAGEAQQEARDWQKAPARQLARLPQVTLVNVRMLRASTEQATVPITLRTLSAAPDDPPTRLHITVNGVPIYGNLGRSLEPTADVPLNCGENRIELAVSARSGLESLRQSITIQRTGVDHGRTIVLAAGVSRYEDARIPALTYADTDARDIAMQLSPQATPDTALLINETAIRQRIMAWRGLLEKTRPEDKVVLFFSGHGMRDARGGFYFATFDIDPSEPEKHGLSYDEIFALLDGIPARRRLVLMDACYSGLAAVDTAGRTTTVSESANHLPSDPTPPANPVDLVKPTASLSLPDGLKLKPIPLIATQPRPRDDIFTLQQMLFADLERGQGAHIIAASGGYEAAIEARQVNGQTVGHGVFTYALLTALRESRQAGLAHITISALRAYAEQQVLRLTGGRQAPMARAENYADDWSL